MSEVMMAEAFARPRTAVPLTIAIPAYNRCESVMALVEQIRSQLEDGDEVIVSDDGSSDGTAERLRGIPGVRVIRNEKNLGMVANWNACLASGTRDWVCIIHDDDGLDPGGLLMLRRACEVAKGPALIGHRYGEAHCREEFRYWYAEPGAWSVLCCPTVPSGSIVHRAAIDAVGMFDPRFKYSTDLEYFPRIAARFPIVIVESPRVIDYRLHGANYQLRTWREADFYEQLEEIQNVVIGYARLKDEKLKRDTFETRMVNSLLHMLNYAGYVGESGVVREAGRRLQRYRHRLSPRLKTKAFVAAATGRCLRPHLPKV